VLNFEEGGENSVLHGDAGSEQFLSEMASPPAYATRHLSMESIYEYGARVGVWRILREFRAPRPAADGVRRRPWRCSAARR
jgi:allantoinase